MGEQYVNYDNALTVLEMKSLSNRRTQLCLKFAKKSEKHSKYKH